jgi:hypothetical protein
MIGELFRVKGGLDIENVAYKGAAPTIQELAGGHIPVGFSSPLSVMAHHRAGTVHILAVTSAKRLALLPDVPTIAEAGVPDVDRRSGSPSSGGPTCHPPWRGASAMTSWRYSPVARSWPGSAILPASPAGRRPPAFPVGENTAIRSSYTALALLSMTLGMSAASSSFFPARIASR